MQHAVHAAMYAIAFAYLLCYTIVDEPPTVSGIQIERSRADFENSNPEWSNGLFIAHKKREPNKNRGYWKTTTLFRIFEDWPDEAFQARMRVSKPLAAKIVNDLTGLSLFRDNKCNNPLWQYSARYKISSPCITLRTGVTLPQWPTPRGFRTRNFVYG
eukprot:1185352-Prorocentrum_minimum.AAC.1